MKHFIPSARLLRLLPVSRHKARLVADGYLTDYPSVNSGVVSLKSIRLLLFIGELTNNLSLTTTNVGNAYQITTY
jgi:hypothetical protein